MEKRKFYTIKYLFLFCILSIAFLATGCVKYDYNISIDNRDNISISEINAVDASILKLSDELKKEINSGIEIKRIHLQNNKYDVVNYSDKKYDGIKSYKKFKIAKFMDVDLPQGFSSFQNTPVVINKTFFKKTYSIAMNYNIKYASRNILQNTGIHSDLLSNNDISIMRKLKPQAELTIKIPNKAFSHNANEVTPNNEYKWNLISNTPVQIELKYEMINYFNIFIVLLTVITTIFLIITIRDKDKDKE